MRATQIPIAWHTDLSIYASELFLKTAGDEYGWIGGTDESGKLRCVLPFTIIRKPMFRLARFRVETIPLGAPLNIEEEKAFLNGAVEFLGAKGVDIIIPPSTNTIFRTFPDGAIASPYGTYLLDLSQTEEILFNNLNSSHRRKVRLAMKANMQIRTGLGHLETAYTLVRDTFKRSNLGFMSLESFRKMVLGLGEHVKIMVAEHDGAVQGAIVVPFSGHTAYYVYGGSIPEPAQGAMNLLHWEAIRLFRKSGVKTYDFVGVRINPEKGSKQEGLMMFKERFGGQLHKGYLWKYSFRSLKYFVYRMAMRLRRGGDIVDQERHKIPTQELRNDGQTEDSASIFPNAQIALSTAKEPGPN
jgi:Acetyltransferase (GNAT) domain